MREHCAIRGSLIALVLLGTPVLLIAQSTPVTAVAREDPRERRSSVAQPPTAKPDPQNTRSNVAKEVADLERRIYARYEESQRRAEKQARTVKER
jgi:hypothetical protein